VVEQGEFVEKSKKGDVNEYYEDESPWYDPGSIYTGEFADVSPSEVYA
jgi:hypothetical protein